MASHLVEYIEPKDQVSACVPVWIVFGTSGEYSDRSEWPVCVLPNEELARKYIEAVTRQYQNIPPSWLRNRWKTETEELIKAHMTLDANIRCGYPDTSWFVERAIQFTEFGLADVIAKSEGAA